ncbi:DUF2808 domain-containing protein [Synechococcus sp. CS-1328]|uniref:DUF2808 domain-containing protein n=1 Tax=Synechococcus sp. CS-1328 TaxID=2847976 RepID=UPI0028801D0E|nr:DUF2808 domain-containing protein [Synechococcus sp. CS-1328]MCT0225795.1 DUF2808 domain-containing protein [Synechococcus sp. CS-1328]MCT0225806.1 DUF2808 domain-containing protein [Synechococcus sp. CS-1328]
MSRPRSLLALAASAGRALDRLPLRRSRRGALPLPAPLTAAAAGRSVLGRSVLAGLALGGLALGGVLSAVLAPQLPALAQGTPSLMEFRWENNRDYRKLYYFITDTHRLKRSEYYLLLRPKDRKTAILKLSISIPESFDVKFDPKRIKLCEMKEGGMLSRTRCEKQIPATIEISENGKAIEIFPDTPVSDQGTIGVYMNIFNPYNIGMYQFNALAQAPGDVPISGYLGSWLIQIDPTN